MDSQNEAPKALHRPLPAQLARRRLLHQDMLTRVTRDGGVTKSNDDNGVSPLDVCGFQSSV